MRWRRCVPLCLAIAASISPLYLVPHVHVSSRPPHESLEDENDTETLEDEEAEEEEAITRHGEPGRCGAEFLKPPCDMFKFIDYDMAKWKDNSVTKDQVMLSRQLPPPDLPIDRKEALLGTFNGQVFLVYSSFNAEMLDKPIHTVLVQLLTSVASIAPHLDVEFLAHLSDLPLVERKKNLACGAHQRFVFSTGSGPSYCDVSLPPGVRPGITNYIYMNDIPYVEKHNLAFWSQSPRMLMPFASVKHPDVINASVSATEGIEGPPAMQQALAQLKAHRVPMQEQFNYRFLLTTAPRCTYTGRVLQFLSSNSVTAIFSNGPRAVAQVAYAAFQENVHFKFVHAAHYLEEIQEMQRRWKELEALPREARRRWQWLTRDEVLQCYMYELMMAYRKKLVYLPSRKGNIKAMLKRSRPDRTKQQAYLQGAEVRTFVTYYGERLYIEPSVDEGLYICDVREILNVSRVPTNMTELCRRVREEMPMP